MKLQYIRIAGRRFDLLIGIERIFYKTNNKLYKWKE